ncbi:MAG: CheR family methyltransferase [Deltaproteobacteria bacterium]|jgi:chemotaxis protein methyltransferase CheR
MNKNEIEAIEVKLLLDAVYQRYGYDFRNYALSTMKRRILKRMEDESLPTITMLLDRVIRDPAVMARLMMDFSITTSAMFRDPACFKTFREKIISMLRTYPFLRIWLDGCGCGEEVLSMSILLREEGLYDRSRIYVTDMNDAVLEKAKSGIFPIGKMKDYTLNYIGSGGKGVFSDYYTAKYDHARFSPELIKNIVFAQHNLVTDSSFNEFHVIFCRNVMIYFNRELQNRVHVILYQSLIHLGILCLGEKENLHFTPHENDYTEMNDQKCLYRKTRL